jgi:hypothetical protein
MPTPQLKSVRWCKSKCGAALLQVLNCSAFEEFAAEQQITV